jgi:zinc transport system substrate-binding protein
MLSIKFVPCLSGKMMKKFFTLLVLTVLLSCNGGDPGKGVGIITVSIPPFKYFVDRIAGNDFSVNVMVPPGSDPHVFEPSPDQIVRLKKSVAYISNGYLGFEMTWLDRLNEVNRSMIRLCLADKIELIMDGDGHEEGVDPHYWLSLESGRIVALSIKELLCDLNPVQKEKYGFNYEQLIKDIDKTDREADSLFSAFRGRPFMIYHPNLAYMARDYGLEEIAVEYNGKEPPPSRLKELIDMARVRRMCTILVQKEYDQRYAGSIASETGAKVEVIDPLSENWLESVRGIIISLHSGFSK